MQAPRFVCAMFDWFAGRSKRFVACTAGVTSIEYAIIAAMISVAIIGGVTTFGSQLNNTWVTLANTVNPQLGH